MIVYISSFQIWMGRFCDLVHGFKPALLMVLVQVAFAGVNVAYKLAANDGMSLNIIIAYRFMFASAFIVPVALIAERRERPKLSWTTLLQSFLSALFGGLLTQTLYLESMASTSTTFASAMANLVPAITFILALFFRLERLGLDSIAGRAKVMGTMVGIGGAMVLTFYKGRQINIWSTHVDLLHKEQSHRGYVASSHGNHVLGSLEAIGSCLSFALWLIIQAKMSSTYPCPYSITALVCVMGSIQATAFALCVEKNWSQWKLGWNIRLLTVAYTGIVASGVMTTVITWCMRMRGPLYVSIFNPLALILVAIVGSLALDEKLHIGIVVGSVLIVCGLYVVLWGKSKEMKSQNQLAPSKSSREAERFNIVIDAQVERTCDDKDVADKDSSGNNHQKGETIKNDTKEENSG